MGTHTALDAMRSAGSILDGIRAADALTIAASRDGGIRSVRLLAQAIADPTDQLTAIAAVHALAQVFEEGADDVLVSVLSGETPFLREHAAWALGAKLPRSDAMTPLVSLVAGGGFTGMIAQRTLQQWGNTSPDRVALALEGALLGIVEPGARARLVETIGIIPGRIAERMLRRVATDESEVAEVRAAAIGALGDLAPREAVIRIVTDIAYGNDELADVARLALVDLTSQSDLRSPWIRGLTVAQLFLHADIDGELSRVGAGDNGGIATLLVRLGDALVSTEPPVSDETAADRPAARTRATGPEGADRRVERVLTLSRGASATALDCLSGASSSLTGHVFAAVPFFGEPSSQADSWPRRIAAERGIRRVLRAAGTVDAIHLRMADVGTLAANTVARDLDIPVIFTVAPDPHAGIQALDSAGTLRRDNFGTVDAAEHYWFRARLVQRLAADAAHTVLLPRPELASTMRELVGIDITAHPERHSVIAEGIGLDVIRQAGDEALTAIVSGDATPAIDELDALLGSLPSHRRELPLAITVGRLHRAKGMATLVEAWAADAELRARVNLLVVGGELDQPSGDELEQLDRIDAVLPRDGAAAEGLLLAGHRANDTVARWLAAAHHGRPGLAAARGIYVCASLKEEFGIALLEAMATGLTVVAPVTGGPATYVEHGVTGFLVDTSTRADLVEGVTDALDLASSPFGAEYSQRASEMVASTFTIQAMAHTLGLVYLDAALANEIRADEGVDWAMTAS